MLKSASFAKSVVGLTGNFFGATNLFPLYFPEIILNETALKECYGVIFRQLVFQR